MSFQTVLVIAGAIFVFIALVGGGVKAKEVSVPPVPRNGRILLGSVGGIFFVIAVWLQLPMVQASPNPTPSAQTTSGGSTSTTASSAPSPSTSPAPTVQSQSPSAAAPEAAISEPRPSSNVGKCKVVRGTSAAIPVDDTLVVAKHQGNKPYYVEVVRSYADPRALSDWSAEQFFNQAAGENFDVAVFMVKTSVVATAKKDPKLADVWALQEVPNDWQKLDSVNVHVSDTTRSDC